MYDRWWEMERVNCLLCGSLNYKPVIRGRDRLHGLPGEFTVVECRDCGLKFTNPRPSEDELAYYYPENYGPHTTRLIDLGSEDNFFWKQVETVIKHSPLGPLLRKLIHSKATFIPDLPEEATVLELGCATGSFLNSLRRKGWNLYGVEVAKSPAAYAQEQLGLNVFCGTLEERDFPDNNFDAIFAWHTVEHLANPRKTLKEIRRVLKRDGYFAFSVPNAGCWEFYVFREKWYALDLPRHLSHYTLASIKKLLEATDFRVEKVLYQKDIINIVVSPAYWLEDIIGKNKISQVLRSFPTSNSKFLALLSLPLAIFLAAIGQAGRMTIVCRSK